MIALIFQFFCRRQRREFAAGVTGWNINVWTKTLGETNPASGCLMTIESLGSSAARFPVLPDNTRLRISRAAIPRG
jgi:hypothetical protein